MNMKNGAYPSLSSHDLSYFDVKLGRLMAALCCRLGGEQDCFSEHHLQQRCHCCDWVWGNIDMGTDKEIAIHPWLIILIH